MVSVAQKPVALLSKIISAYFRGTRLKRAKSLSPPCEKVPECLFNFSGQDDVEGLRVIMTATRCRDDSAARPPADTLDESLSHPPPISNPPPPPPSHSLPASPPVAITADTCAVPTPPHLRKMTTAAARKRSGANGMKGGRSEARDPPLVVAQAQVAADVAADTAEDAAVDAAAAADFFLCLPSPSCSG